ncbi:hypothetical protein [Morganella morganii]|uniref:hypothetical protein n=1 Tax=Morganella morganii TaxID=582 RepID=UPI003EBE8CB7
MAGNAFDFELNADDRASGQITVLEEKIRSLNPALDEARDKLKLGGDESVTGLRGIGDLLRDVSEEAKSGVQSIGDMIPPLKNFGALAGKLTGIGGIGAIIAGGGKLITGMAEEGKNITTSAANTGMTVEESTRLSGTLQQRGVSKDDSRSQMEGYYEKLSQAVIGKDDQLLASIRHLGAEIVQRKDGSVDLTKTLLSIEKAVEKLPESRNWELRDNLKLTPDMIALIREKKVQERLDNSDRFGLTMKGEFAEKMTEVDTQLSEAGAKLTGKMNQIQKSLYEFIDSPSIIPDFGDLDGAMKNIRESELRINDTEDNFYHGDKRQDIIRWAAKDKEYRDSLSWFEDLRMTALDPDDKMYTDIYNKWSDKWEEQRERAEAGKNKPVLNSKVPDNWVQHDKYNPNSRGFRNKNPGNLREADNQIGLQGPEGDTMAVFSSYRDGFAAMSRQLMLDAERGKNRIADYIEKYAPASENKTQEYIKMVSDQTGFGPYENLNMHDPQVLAKLMNAMIKVENGAQPFSYEQVMEGVMDSITDDRWKGRRNPDRVREQRDTLAMQQAQQQETASAATDFKIDRDPTQALLAFSEQLSKVLQENQPGGTLEIVLTNAETGTKSTVNVKPKGRVTTAMNMP